MDVEARQLRVLSSAIRYGWREVLIGVAEGSSLGIVETFPIDGLGSVFVFVSVVLFYLKDAWINGSILR